MKNILKSYFYFKTIWDSLMEKDKILDYFFSRKGVMPYKNIKDYNWKKIQSYSQLKNKIITDQEYKDCFQISGYLNLYWRESEGEGLTVKDIIYFVFEFFERIQ